MPRKRERKDAESRREEILRKATVLLARDGFRAMSFQKIADALGVSQSAVMHHFPNKESLIEATIEKIVLHNHRLVQENVLVTDDAMTRLRKHFSGNLDWAIRYRDESQVILLLYHLAAFHPRFSSIYRVILRRGRERVLELVAAAVREGIFRKDTALPEVATLLHDMLVGGIISAICLPATWADAAKIRRRWEVAFAAFRAATRKERAGR